MSKDRIILLPQHPACITCDWQQHAQDALNALIKGGEPIKSASVNCKTANESHARMEAIALAPGRDPDSEKVYPLVIGVLSCQRRSIDPSFSTPVSLPEPE